MLKGGKRVVTVDDPGKDAKELSTLEMALRLPGRDIVVPTADDWHALETYVVASNPKDPQSGEFYVQNSKRIFLIRMKRATTPDDNASEGPIPRAKPVGK